jgi:hypothetical protein
MYYIDDMTITFESDDSWEKIEIRKEDKRNISFAFKLLEKKHKSKEITLEEVEEFKQEVLKQYFESIF